MNTVSRINCYGKTYIFSKREYLLLFKIIIYLFVALFPYSLFYEIFIFSILLTARYYIFCFKGVLNNQNTFTNRDIFTQMKRRK